MPPDPPAQQILDTMSHAIFWKDTELRYQGANRRFLEMVGCKTPAELAGKTDFDMPWRERATLYRQIDQRVLDSAQPESRIERQMAELNLPERRQETWLWVIKRPMFDESGQVVGVLGIAEDVTDQHRVQEAIRALVQMTFTTAGEDFFRQLARQMANAMATRYALVAEILPSRPHWIRALALWNGEEFLEGLEFSFSGYPCAEVLQGKFCEFPDDVLSRFPAAELLRSLKVRSYLGAPLFDSTGRLLGHVAILDTQPMMSITSNKQILEMFAVRASAELERKRIDEALRESQATLERRVEERTADLATAHESLRSLLHIVSHDLRAPLVNIKGFAGELKSASEIIRETIGPGVAWLGEAEEAKLRQALEEDIPEALEFIDTSINRIDHFMGTLLKLSAEGRRELHMEKLDVNKIVDDLLKILAYAIEQRQAKVTVGRLPAVVADQISLEQILSNLLSNAVLYLDPERPGKIEVTGERTQDHVLIRIRDNGRGIPNEDRSKLFLPFRRGRYTDVEGEGMGLAYVEALVRRHGGRIWCESEVGVGTTFSFTLSSELMENDPRTGVHLLAPIHKALGIK